MKTLIKILLLLQIPVFGITQTFTLENALNEGLKNRIEIKNQKLLSEIAKRQNAKIAAQWLPQISGSVDKRWNTQLQTTILPFDITGQNPDGSSKVKFGVPFNNLVGLQADQKIFDANKKIDIAINENTITQREIDLEKQTVAIKQAVSEAYYAVILQQEQRKLNQEAYDRTIKAKENARTKYQMGTLLENDYNRFILDENNAKISIEKSNLEVELALSTLKYQMGLPETAKIEVQEDLNTILAKTSKSYDLQYENRPEIKAEETALKLNALNVNKQMAKNKATISAYGNYSLLQLNTKFNPFSANTWFPYNYVGIKLNLPIFNGKQSSLNATDFKIQQEINQNNLQKLRADFEQETITSTKQMVQAKLDLEQTQKNIQLAQSIYGIDKFRFESGVLVLSDLKNSEYSLKQAESNYLNAIYSFLLAELKYKKATGNL
ncbi:TolC family protein [Lacihabitans sp. LS3-19]|uniref:TolC family protein n=1 Tax=Lacihabitans sp. LS3-19 TaxID=2487335 RepID=UPI0020CD3F29|nr:TolC family protein [Lacihabitans sp. LS3-19]MCP9766696.1 TolC family protein [Lacihabitans sp. LS3-19]